MEYLFMPLINISVNVGRSVMSLSSHAGDSAAKATWSWCDVVAESC
jgi:hypothetical protein